MSNKVSPIPPGYHTITTYLIVDDGVGAIDFYKKAFNAKEIMRFSKPGNKIGHAELQIGDSKLMLADEYPDMDTFGPKKYQGSPVSMHLYVEDVDSFIDRAVSAGAKLVRPVENMFYGDRAGAVTDPYGHNWYVATHIEDLTEEQINERAAKFHSELSK